LKYLSIIFIFCFCGLAKSSEKKQTYIDYDIIWHKERPLRWVDFQGYPNYNSKFSAITVSSIIQNINYCDSNNIFTFDVTAVFKANKSWTRTGKWNVLQHEQKHFDLTEVYARKIRKAFTLIQNPCNYSLEELSKIYEIFMEELQIIQNQYDKETDHGNIKEAQFYWNKKIADMLIETDEYALQ